MPPGCLRPTRAWRQTANHTRLRQTHGTRCIYNWYNCTDSDCDNIGAGDNCPSAPNQTQRDTDGETLDLGALYSFDDVTNVRGDNAGDICSDDDDGDGLSTGQEFFFIPCSTATGPTDPLNDDSDGDMINDGVECLLGTDPVNAASKPAATPDADRDGLADGYETLVFGTNPNIPDTDGDKLGDGTEALKYRSNPLNNNTDGAVEPRPCRDGQEAGSLNNDYAANPGDQALLANYFGTYGSTYSHFDHARRNFDINRDGVINPGDQALQAAIVGAGGICIP